METLAWSFDSLCAGKCPKKDLQNRTVPYNRGKRLRPGILWAISGDLEWFAMEFGFPYSASNLLCPYCMADQNQKRLERPFTDMRPTAAWRGSYFTIEQLKAKYDHPLFWTPAVSVLSLKLDILHVLDLGVAAYLFGSVLVTVWAQMEGNREAKMKELNRLLVELYDDVGVEAVTLDC